MNSTSESETEGKHSVSSLSTTNNLTRKVILIVFIVTVILCFLLLGFYFLSNLPCRGAFGVPQYTGKVRNGEFEFGDADFSAISVEACVVSIQSKTDNETFLKIGFFDKYWRLKKYTARLGGKVSKVAICKLSTCTTLDSGKLANELVSGNVYNLFLVNGDENNQIIDESPTEYKIHVNLVKKAILMENNFPNMDGVIQISQVEL